MFPHFWWKCASPGREGRLHRVVVVTVGAAMLAVVSTRAPVLAGAPATGATAAAGGIDELDTEDMFGFIEGADIGRAGQHEVEVDTSLHSGKNSGTYGGATGEFQYKYTAFENFRISAAATLAYYDIAGVAGINDLHNAAVQSLSFNARFLLLDRNKTPFGLTLSVEPHWGFVDETSGVQLNHFGWQGMLLADRELVPSRLIGGLNLQFDTDRTRLLPDHAIEQAPTLGIGFALALQTIPGLWLGGEVRYLRGYEGAALDVFSGHALYAGPALYTRLGEKGWMSAAFDVQVWGGAVGVPGALDLMNFERYQALLRVGFDF
jgi:hypothetical protein